MSPSSGTVTGWKRPIASGSESTCTIGLYDAMPVWLANDAPNTISRSDSFMCHDATGVPLRPSTPHASGWSSATIPLALNVVRIGAFNSFGEPHDVVDAAPRAVADDRRPAAARAAMSAVA